MSEIPPSTPPSDAASGDAPAVHTSYRCLDLIARHHGREVRRSDLPSDLGPGPSAEAFVQMVRRCDLESKVVSAANWAKLAKLGKAYPLVALLNNGNYVILVGVAPAGPPQNPMETFRALVLDPLMDQPTVMALEEEQFCKAWSGTLVLIKRRYSLTDENQPFGLRWFLPEIFRQGQFFRDIALAAMMMHVIAFSTPLLFQVVIDKVIPHQSSQTLYVVMLVFVMATLFDAAFSFVRQNLLLFATNKIDARLVSRTFSHLLSLPMHFFESSTAGILAKHMQQTEKVRQFLTGRLFQTVLDAMALPVLLVVLLFYSAKLVGVVLFFSALIALIIGVMVPMFRRRLNELYRAEGSRQAHLVEAVHGMRTIKSLSLEQQQKQEWDNKVADAVHMNHRVGKMGAIGNVSTHAIEKLMQIAVIGLGAADVFDGTMSIGALVAFNMLSGRVTGPLVQIVGLINEFQETALSVAMLGEVMNHPPERPEDARGIRPAVRGLLQFENVSFSYPGSATPALDRLNFTVKEGQVIGVVGRSGSGKTTITRLIQAIHAPQSGVIRLDGVDIRQFDLSYLRRNIGVVLQDNFLFRGTIYQNIAATRPDASTPDVIAAARLAGADEFIERLPQSYNTMIEENGSNFSGGQRQRLAIARALLSRPPVLIFDEATSALDPETESIIQTHLAEIARGRTMVIVSHRLASLVDSDAIMVLEQGRIVDFAPHSVLLSRCEIYRHLWLQQNRHVKE